MLGILLPVFACAFCPACLTTLVKVLSVAGIGFGLDEFQHAVLLAAAVSVSLLVSARRAWRSWRVWPVAVAGLGSALVLAGHLLSEADALEWSGAAMLLAGGLMEHFRLRQSSWPRTPPTTAVTAPPATETP